MASPIPEGEEFRQLLASVHAAEIPVIKSLLDAEELEYFFKGESFQQVYPGVEAVRLLVREKDFERAKEILKDIGPQDVPPETPS